MSKKVDLPAPLGPMRARISPRSRANDTPSTARTPPNARRTFSTSRTGALSVTLARPHDAEDPARNHKHQGHEDDAEHELPVFRVTRHHGVEQLVERNAERRARQRVHTPQQHHHEQLRSEEHTSELQSPCNLVCRLLLEKKKKKTQIHKNSIHESLPLLEKDQTSATSRLYNRANSLGANNQETLCI